MSRARDEYVQLIFDKIEREKATRAASPPPVTLAPAIVPLVPKPALTPRALPTAADREYDAVASAALARIEAAEKLRRDEDSAVAAILAAVP